MSANETTTSSAGRPAVADRARRERDPRGACRRRRRECRRTTAVSRCRWRACADRRVGERARASRRRRSAANRRAERTRRLVEAQDRARARVAGEHAPIRARTARCLRRAPTTTARERASLLGRARVSACLRVVMSRIVPIIPVSVPSGRRTSPCGTSRRDTCRRRSARAPRRFASRAKRTARRRRP